MRHVLALGTVVLLAFFTAWAGEVVEPVPNVINYQGRLTSSSPVEAPLTGAFDMTFRIFGSVGGSDVYWEETWLGVSVNNGIFNVLLGSNGSPLTQELFDSDDASIPMRFLEIEVAGEILSPRQQIGSVAYAMIASNPGPPGEDGFHCWDLNQNHVCNASENRDGVGGCTPADCQGEPGVDGEDGADGANGADGSDGAPGAPGVPGDDGLHCWDLNGNGVCDGGEDTNGGGCSASDCQGAPGPGVIPGYQIVTRTVTAESAGPGGQHGGCVQCPAGKVAIGGGGEASPTGVTMILSQPTGTIDLPNHSWCVTWRNSTEGTVSITPRLRVICADGP